MRILQFLLAVTKLSAVTGALLLFPLLLLSAALSVSCAEQGDRTGQHRSNGVETTIVGEGVATLAKGGRLLAVDVGPDSSGDYTEAFELARGAGMEVVGLFLQWNALEPIDETYDVSFLTIANAYYPATGVALDLTLAPVNTTQRVFPEDLVGRRFDDPEVIERFRRLIDVVLVELPDTEIHSVNIGSEMDILFQSDAASWSRFEVFYRATVDHLKTRRPELTITVEPTFQGMTGFAREAVRRLNERSDAIAVSYYPSEENGDMASPSRVLDDFQLLTTLYPAKPIHFLQFGYATSPLVGGSELRQAEFVSRTFEAWDLHAERIKMIDFTWLHDLSPESVESLVTFYCGSDEACRADAKFPAFLGSLGMRTWHGEDKPAWQRLKNEAAARGW